MHYRRYSGQIGGRTAAFRRFVENTNRRFSVYNRKTAETYKYICLYNLFLFIYLFDDLEGISTNTVRAYNPTPHIKFFFWFNRPLGPSRFADHSPTIYIHSQKPSNLVRFPRPSWLYLPISFLVIPTVFSSPNSVLSSEFRLIVYSVQRRNLPFRYVLFVLHCFRLNIFPLSPLLWCAIFYQFKNLPQYFSF